MTLYTKSWCFSKVGSFFLKIKRLEVYTLARRIQTLCCMKMVEDVVPMPCLAQRGEEHNIAEIFQDFLVDKAPNAVYHCNGGNKKTYMEAPVIDNCIGCSNGKASGGLKRVRLEGCYTDLCDERVLSLVAKHANWNPFSICLLSCLCKKTRAISDRHLWREFCRSRARCLQSALSSNHPMQAVAGHSVRETRFSRTSGRFFLIPKCRSDILYVSDPCEHANTPEDVGLFRGVFSSFDKSETKKLLIIKRVPISEGEYCPYCKVGVWNMKCAQMTPKSASTRLAAYNETIDYSVCLNGHVIGRCALLHLTESEESGDDKQKLLDSALF
ncbi:hypothetical protein GOP47_0023141 [Adiantum capillus-veneris]|uniref:Uncharacterized protein n=1 Tax=Adiantum capillus-veneris TaxID=13818 RepID=A0A9D4Z6N7_ADICA|nr:hypothetical protein GOP47_0023141 [Adiantum capillus-veneris]